MSCFEVMGIGPKDLCGGRSLSDEALLGPTDFFKHVWLPSSGPASVDLFLQRQRAHLGSVQKSRGLKTDPKL